MKVFTAISSQRILHILIISLLPVCFVFAQSGDTVQVGTGWNMVGSLSSGPVSDILRSEPDTIIASAFFAYNPGGGYEAKDTLKKGGGYWVKVKEDGLIIFSTGGYSGPCGNSFDYEGKTYHTVLIGTQCWMKENLNAGAPVLAGSVQQNNGVIEKYCYNNLLASCDTYGGLYQWNEAMQYTTAPGAKGICPQGWHIPTLEEFQILVIAAGEYPVGLLAVGQGLGTNTTGFSALLGGACSAGGTFMYLNEMAVMWSSSTTDTSPSFMYIQSSGVVNYMTDNSGGGMSIRCIRD